MSLLASDSNVHHAFTLTPSISFTIACGDEAEVDRLEALSECGGVLMDVAN